MLAEVSVAF
jgi:hypothetical protein